MGKDAYRANSIKQKATFEQLKSLYSLYEKNNGVCLLPNDLNIKHQYALERDAFLRKSYKKIYSDLEKALKENPPKQYIAKLEWKLGMIRIKFEENKPLLECLNTVKPLVCKFQRLDKTTTKSTEKSLAV